MNSAAWMDACCKPNVQLTVGPAGSGKTHRLINDILDEQDKPGNACKVVLSPQNILLESLRNELQAKRKTRPWKGHRVPSLPHLMTTAMFEMVLRFYHLGGKKTRVPSFIKNNRSAYRQIQASFDGTILLRLYIDEVFMMRAGRAGKNTGFAGFLKLLPRSCKIVAIGDALQLPPPSGIHLLKARGDYSVRSAFSQNRVHVTMLKTQFRTKGSGADGERLSSFLCRLKEDPSSVRQRLVDRMVCFLDPKTGELDEEVFLGKLCARDSDGQLVPPIMLCHDNHRMQVVNFAVLDYALRQLPGSELRTALGIDDDVFQIHKIIPRDYDSTATSSNGRNTPSYLCLGCRVVLTSSVVAVKAMDEEEEGVPIEKRRLCCSFVARLVGFENVPFQETVEGQLSWRAPATTKKRKKSDADCEDGSVEEQDGEPCLTSDGKPTVLIRLGEQPTCDGSTDDEMDDLWRIPLLLGNGQPTVLLADVGSTVFRQQGQTIQAPQKIVIVKSGSAMPLDVFYVAASRGTCMSQLYFEGGIQIGSMPQDWSDFTTTLNEWASHSAVTGKGVHSHSHHEGSSRRLSAGVKTSKLTLKNKTLAFPW